MQPTIGRILIYTLSQSDADAINRRRTTGTAIAERLGRKEWPEGAQAHIGNGVQAGMQVPLIVTRVWSPTCVNGQALLDGNDTLWVTSATEGEGERAWQWPARAA